jgi:zinc D-Ala-D-Ala carboxypeptidase
MVAVATVTLVGLVGCVAPEKPPGPVEAVVEPDVTPPPAPAPHPGPEPEPVVDDADDAFDAFDAFDRELYSIDDADSVWVVVNKARPLDPIDYAPDDLVAPSISAAFPALMRAEATSALEQMYDEAVAEGVPFRIQSSYRSFSVQQRVKADHVARFGQDVSDRRSARAGHSEHQTGLAVDLTTPSGECSINVCFKDTAVGVWLADNSWRYGFIVRYPEGKTDITGYVFEPWHFRYVGKELAAHLHELGFPTLEEFFGLDPAPDYLS